MTESPDPTERPRVLIVHPAGIDGPKDLEIALTRLGYESYTRVDTDRLDDAFRVVRPDVALLDLSTDGRAALRTIAELRVDPGFRHVPVIVIGDHKLAAVDVTLTECLERPVAPSHLIHRVKANVEMKQLIEHGQRRSERLASLLEISRALNSHLDSGAILYFIARKISEEMELARCSFIVPDLVNGIGRVIACKDDPNIQSLEINLGNYPEIIQVLRTGAKVVVEDVELDPIMAGVRKFADVFRDQSIMTLPLKFQNEIIGVLQIRKKSQKKGFAPREVEFCELLANAAANALKNAQLYEDIEKHNGELRRQKRSLERLSEELRGKNAELLRLQQLREDFTAMIVHDLRSPLMIVQGVLDLQSYRHRGKPDERELLADGLSVTKKMLHLVSNLLEVSKIEAGELRLDVVELDVATAVREAVEPFNVIASRRGMELVSHIQAGLPRIWADSGCVGQILDNLLSNALKFTPDGGRVEVAAQMAPGDDRSICLRVTDSGCGVPAADLGKIFEKFRQSGAGGGRMGTGLGLTIVQLLTTAHSGTVAVESKLGSGSSFTARLPIGNPPGSRADARGSSAPAAPGGAGWPPRTEP